jgi:hypothetical protein
MDGGIPPRPTPDHRRPAHADGLEDATTNASWYYTLKVLFARHVSRSVWEVTDDAYEILQVHPKADLDVIRAAFRTLARKYHPDFGGTGARMVSLNEAWHKIGDPKRRKAYDAELVAEAVAGRNGATAGAQVPTMDPRPRPGASWQPAARTGTILDFGRYAGWSIVDLGRHDPIYLEWLGRTPIGRPMRSEIEEVLGLQSATSPSPAVVKARPRSRWGR